MHRLVLLAEAQTGVVYPEKLYGLRIPAFSEVYGDEVKYTVVSVTVQRQAETDGHRVVVVVNKIHFEQRPRAALWSRDSWTWGKADANEALHLHTGTRQTRLGWIDQRECIRFISLNDREISQNSHMGSEAP
jgi:hypothetical protein